MVAEEIPPSILLSNNIACVKGIVSEIGGKTSHVAILASNLGIPSVFGIKEISKTLRDGELIYINGNEGYIENNLTDTNINTIKEKIKKEELLKESLKKINDKMSLTKDNKRLEITANAGELSELDKLLEVNFDGIGLFRTEFLFLNRSTAPEEEYLFNVYKIFRILYVDLLIFFQKSPLQIHTTGHIMKSQTTRKHIKAIANATTNHI